MSKGRLKRIVPYVVISILAISLLYTAIEISALNDKLNLRVSETWIDDELTLNPNSEIHFDFKPLYAGYLVINPDTFSPNVVVYVSYTYDGSYHSFETNGIASIPVLPAEIRIRVSNVNEDSATVLLNVTYVY